MCIRDRFIPEHKKSELNKNGIMYSHNDLKDFLIKHYSMKASELYSAIKENLFKKIGNKKIADDVTFLIMEIY